MIAYWIMARLQVISLTPSDVFSRIYSFFLCVGLETDHEASKGEGGSAFSFLGVGEFSILVKYVYVCGL